MEQVTNWRLHSTSLLTAAGPREAPIPLIDTILMRYRQ
jgi:hypothetical protein